VRAKDLSWQETDPSEGVAVGRDPRKCTKDEMIAWGHVPAPVLSVIREKCLDCCEGTPSEVRRCVAITCALWPYRMNHNPMRDKREMSEEEREAVGKRFAMAREAKNAGKNKDGIFE
jgi:hypothetical protein